MRRGFGLIGLLVTLILFVIVGAVAYNIGWSEGVNTHLPAATDGTANAAPYYHYGPGFHGGFGLFPLFGIFWFLLILFGIFFLFRMAFWGFWGRRMFYGGGWGHGPGGHGRWGSFEERAQEWHKQQHGESPPSTSPPPTDTRSV